MAYREPASMAELEDGLTDCQERLKELEWFVECRKECSGDEGYRMAEVALSRHKDLARGLCFLLVTLIFSLSGIVWMIAGVNGELQRQHVEQQREIMHLNKRIDMLRMQSESEHRGLRGFIYEVIQSTDEQRRRGEGE